MRWPEIVATLLGVANIVLLVRRSIWNYPFGLATVAMYAGIFMQEKLYSDALLQPFLFVAQVYGWRAWARVGGEAEPVAVERLRPAGWAGWLGASVAVSAVWGFAMARLTDAALPYWDAAVAIFSVCAQLLLARRYLENWLWWIAVDVTAVALYAARGLYWTAGLYILFLLFATAGLVSWGRAREVHAA